MIKLLQRHKRFIVIFFMWINLFQIVYVPATYALTSGPSQPEVQGFQPAGTNDMVDLFSGDFSYNIPLFELPGPNGGYPFNLSYQAGVGMDAEASWVGLGFSLNPGAINRQMRGLPDEFNGDSIYTKMAIEPSITVGLGAGVGLEKFGAGKDVGTFGLGVTYNNFKGFGYSIDASVGFQKTTGSGMTGGIGLDVKIDSQEGVSASPNLSLGQGANSFGLSAGYNSKTGLQAVSVSHQLNSYGKVETRTPMGLVNHSLAKVGSVGQSSATLSLASPSYTPMVSLPMRNINLNAKIAPGAAFWGFFAKGYIKGFYSEQWLADNKKWMPSKAYGYLNYQNAWSERSVLDFNREKDGMVTKESPNLPIPSLTYDIYSVTGQGISAMYRPMRNDRGVIHDPETTATSIGGSVGVDAAPTLTHTGINLSVNHTRSTSGKWTEQNYANPSSAFQKKNADDMYEPVYYKVHGESTPQSNDQLEQLGGTNAVRVALSGYSYDASADNAVERSGWRNPLLNSALTDRERKSRAQVIQTITNDELISNGTEAIPHLKVRYIDANGRDTVFNRKDLPGHHTAAFSALTADGLRYNYGIPAYNLKQEEATFSALRLANSNRVSTTNDGNPCGAGDPCYDHKGTERFLKRVEMPKYAHSYLLTSIIGPDYVDVTGNGVTEDDLGYWVRFTYKKTADEASPYKWRDPYSMAHYQEGWKTDPRDDKGTYTYGEKELWYLVKAETKSHVTTFILEEREDGRGVDKKLKDSDVVGNGKSIYRLKEIRLFSRLSGETHPIKVVKFDYDYSLCPGVYNNVSHQGKLTLKKVWFEYGNSERGRFNPYVFSYHGTTIPYEKNAYDRWGNYKPNPAEDPLHNIDFPYSEQDPSKKEDIDKYASAWSLSEIQLPSGGKILVDYEADDYGYVQHLPAMQMTDIVGPTGATSGEFNLNDSSIVKFKLEKPIAGSRTLTEAEMRNEVMRYLDPNRPQIYFKALINIRSWSEDFYEYISGYVDVDFSPTGKMKLHKDANGNYAFGSFKLAKEEGVNPLSLRAWQHVRTNQPELANSNKKLESFKQTDDNSTRLKQIRSLGNVWDQVVQVFSGYYDYCKHNDWGREIVAGKSWVRLNSPDKIKYGGGLRVKQITMKDNWADDNDGVYGQVYDYSIVEGKQTISSGVAAYEPIIGGEENPLRYAKKFTQAVPLRSDNNMFFEFPVNESYYPGPQVGYRRVKITSLAAASLAGETIRHGTVDGKRIFPKPDGKTSYGTTGATVHEFYTAKDFPVITDETEKINKPFKMSVPIPYLGNVAMSKLTTSQGYSIVTNDMHGKPKKVSTYRQNRLGGWDPEPGTWVQYNYYAEQRNYGTANVSQLSAVFKDNNDGTLSIASKEEQADPSVIKYSIGQENEFFLDMRQYVDNTWEGGANINLDVLIVPTPLGLVTVPVGVPWPSIGANHQMLRTSVANKIVFRSGILESTEAYDGGSRVITQNIKWDKNTGGVLLTRVNNNFDAPIYSYSIPAYTQYQGMGAAYQNIDLKFTISEVTKDYVNATLYSFKPSVSSDKLFPGDEILLYASNSNWKSPITRIVFAGKENEEYILYSSVPLTTTTYRAMIVRSGYRNQLNVSAGNITALKDPSKPGQVKTYDKVISIPNE